MAVSTELRHAEWHGTDVGVPTVRNPAFDAFWILRLGFTVAPILFGLDKFFNWMVDWERYLWPEVATWFDASAESVMDVVGVVEIAAGVMVFLAPRIGSFLVAAWLGTIVTNLVAYSLDSDTDFWDMALRDLGLMIGAIALFLLSSAYAGARRKATAVESDEAMVDTTGRVEPMS